MSDKARAAAAGTIHDYIYPCPMDRGVLERWGVSADTFENALRSHADDDGLGTWLRENVPATKVQLANRWLLDERRENLDRQDREEGVAAESH